MIAWGTDRGSVDGGTRDYAKLRAAGASFAWARGSFAYHGSGRWNCVADPDLLHDWPAIAAAGLVRGTYMFPVLQATQTASQQVAVLKAAVDAAGGLRPGVDLPPCLDVEFPGAGIAATGLDRAGIMKWIREAVAELRKQFGCWPIIYTSGRVWDDTDADCLASPPAPDLLECPLWLARYAYKTREPAVLPPPASSPPPTPSPWVAVGPRWANRTIACFPHQYQGDALGVPGFSSTVDLDRHASAKRGDVGPLVSWAQRKLKLGADGDFGPMTENAVRDFQSKRIMPSTGVVDLQTFAAMSWL